MSLMVLQVILCLELVLFFIRGGISHPNAKVGLSFLHVNVKRSLT